MIQGEITIDENLCRGCGYCEKFCSRGCIVIPEDKFSDEGFLVPVFKPDKCNACGVCARMCPQFAIEVYKIVEISVSAPH